MNDRHREALVIAIQYLLDNFGEFRQRCEEKLPYYELPLIGERRFRNILTALQAPTQGVDVKRMLGITKYPLNHRSREIRSIVREEE